MSTKQYLYINAYIQRVPTRILVLVQHVPARILVLAPAVYITVSDHTRIIRRYYIHCNPMSISILLGITRTSLNNVKVRCVVQDECVYNSYVRNMDHERVVPSVRHIEGKSRGSFKEKARFICLVAAFLAMCSGRYRLQRTFARLL
jgi:hypothetical protein